MELNDYQVAAMKTAVYPSIGDNLPYAVLGLVGEAGEVAEKVKKMIRDDGGVLRNGRGNEIAKELSDVLWYVAAVAHELAMPLEAIAQINLAKLASRAERGQLHGDGDNR